MFELLAIGNLGADPEMKYLADGKEMTTFSVAVNTGKGDDRITSWINVTAFGKVAETIYTYAKKGTKMFVRGKPGVDDKGEPKKWTSKDGTPHATWYITLNNYSDFEFLSSKEGGE